MVAYLRVSRKSQGADGLGIGSQRAAVASYVASAGCELLREYVEVETGKKHDLTNRPELRRAIAHARRSKAILVVAKLDRLLRSTVICTLLKTNAVQFVACDNPHANELTIDILAAVAANEVREISRRTKDALAVKKAKGVILGSARPGAPQLTDEARAKGNVAAAVANRAKKVAAYDDLVPEVSRLRSEGLSFAAIAAALNAEGHTTRRGKPFSAMQAFRVAEMSRSII
jgi:DNA invertase Pin-like site-specific DNA recombinase